MPENSLPDYYNALHVVGVTRGEGKIRPTVYFKTGSHFTQSHKTENNIGYHAPPGPHLYFGNVRSAELRGLKDRAAFEAGDRRRRSIAYIRAARRLLIEAYTNGTGRPMQVKKPSIAETGDGLVLLELWTGGFHESRSYLEPVTIDEAVKLVVNIRSRSADTKKRHPITREYYFAD